MNQISLGTVLKGCGFAIAAGLCVYNMSRISKQQRKLDEFKKQQLKDIESLQRMKEGQQIHIKVKLQKNQNNKNNAIIKKIPIHYNQFYLEQPSDAFVVRQLNNSQFFEPLFDKKQWNFVDRNGKRVSLYGIPYIVGDVYHINRKFEQFQNGTLKRFWGGICYYFECIFDFIRKRAYEDRSRQIPINRQPLISGPVVGILHYAIGILSDVYFVLKVRFDGELHQAVLLAESSNALIGQYEFEVNTAKTGVILFGALASLLGYFIYKDLKKTSIIQGIIQAIEKKRHRKWLEVENVEEDKACIICYTNCRNLILFDCKHLIMCWGCWKTMKEDHCPICKKVISTAKVIHSDKEVAPAMDDRVEVLSEDD